MRKRNREKEQMKNMSNLYCHLDENFNWICEKYGIGEKSNE